MSLVDGSFIWKRQTSRIGRLPARDTVFSRSTKFRSNRLAVTYEPAPERAFSCLTVLSSTRFIPYPCAGWALTCARCRTCTGLSSRLSGTRQSARNQRRGGDCRRGRSEAWAGYCIGSTVPSPCAGPDLAPCDSFPVRRRSLFELQSATEAPGSRANASAACLGTKRVT